MTEANREEEQAATLSFLRALPGDHGGRAREIETSLNRLFLSGSKVYKLKRALAHDYCNFLSRESRRAACEREMAVNRRFAPDLYRGVREIKVSAGVASFDGPGQVLDAVVEMERFNRDDQLDRLLQRGQLTNAIIDALGDRIAGDHLSAEVVKDADFSSDISSVIANLSKDRLRAEPPEHRVEEWSLAAARLAGANTKHFVDRRETGFVRRCHGDLHLANLVLINGAPTPFDALEFDERMATIDILYDLAFLLMDLYRFNKRGEAARTLSRYLSATGDYGGVKALPLFISVRAAIRAMATGFNGERAQSAEFAELALSAKDGSEKPALIAIGGFSGSGKSTLAYALNAEAPGYGSVVSLHSDIVRKRLLALDPEENAPLAAYKDEISERTYAAMASSANKALRADATVILDATFGSTAQREAVRNLAAEANAPFIGLWLDAPTEVLTRRIVERKNDPSDATPEVLLRQRERFTEPTDREGWIKPKAAADMEEILQSLTAKGINWG
ncbi:MAG: AAA family ATPase [Pseudomonadota bacterium]